MTRLFLLLLATVAGAGYLANAIKEKGPGYVYVYFDQYSIETSVWFAIAIIACLVVIIVVLIRFLPWCTALLYKLGYFPRSFFIGRAKKLAYEGKLAFLNQQWRIAAKKLSKAGKNSRTPFIDYVMAARSALTIGDIETALSCAKLAKDSHDFDAVTYELLQIDLAMAETLSAEQELALQTLLDKHPTEPVFLDRAVMLYTELGKWQLLQQLLPKLKKYKVYDEKSYAQVLVNMATGLMPMLAQRGEHQELKALWKSVAKVHDDEQVIEVYCRALVSLRESEQAQKILELHLRRHWCNHLALQYVHIAVKNKQQQLQFMEELLAHYGEQQTLLTILGELEKDNTRYAKAKEYFNKSLQLQISSAALCGLADIAIIQHDYAQAVQLLQQALTCTHQS